MMGQGWQAFWHMGGYGFYVWGSFGACALLWWLECVLLRRARRAALTAVRRQILMQGDAQ